ncbi:DUF4254 domain-containing protein [Geobacter sp. DSM 9736]|uniref:DUF4254 domain-containing protein n=1 Tax=Geobacter sp. DSM 9736 TaxID=1277350 RepID=UPI000B50A77D|nr:DUF4254 domain-containing protein [Geobacter sp. DSM 9736]SNB45032.1 Protein of unknown function [Geobacter sp. DSM 9736]
MMQELELVDLPEAFDECIACWHKDASRSDGVVVAINPIAIELAYRNFMLWHEEDKARRTDVADSEIAQVKRNIDRYNQQRNDLIEKLDEAILSRLLSQGEMNPRLPINSETPGSIVDRISILSLKVCHMEEDTLRDDVSEEHRERSRARLAILREQRSDLATALALLIDEYRLGKKQMKLYRQFKMYNDPSLNPEIYRRSNKQ